LPFINSSLKRARKIIVSGNNIINSSPLLRKYREKCAVIPFGINYDSKDEDTAESEKITEKYRKDKLILGIGRLVYYKGFEYTIKSMVDVNANLLIIGTGPEEKKLKKLISELKLENKVFIIKPQKKLATFFLASDLFVFPSTERSEAFGLVQLEALARGIPIVNTRLGTAVEEVSLDGVTGLTVETKNSKALSEAINKILNNENLRLEYSKNAIKRYQEFFTQEKFLKRIKSTLT
jgi:glycosyltransferase involved in cell wall biosynthesis